MHPKVERGARRVHDAQIKSKVLAECRQPGASVSAVALAHGLNANLVRKWLKGRGLQRAGVKSDGSEVAPAARSLPSAPVEVEARLQFVPVEVPVPVASKSIEAHATIHIELRHRHSHVAVRWPATQASECAQWLREFTTAVLK